MPQILPPNAPSEARPALTVVRRGAPSVAASRESTEARVEALKAQLAQIEQQLHAEREARARAQRAGAPEILAELKAAGNLNVTQLMQRCQLQKSSVWHHLNALEREGKIWLRQTHRADGRKHTIAYHADAIVT